LKAIKTKPREGPPPPLVLPPPQAAKVSKARGDRLRVTLFLRISGSTLHRLEANHIANREPGTVIDIYKALSVGLGGWFLFSYVAAVGANHLNSNRLVAFWRVPSKALREAHTGAVICVYNVQLAIEFDLCMAPI
jgi:hypothetical protein